MNVTHPEPGLIGAATRLRFFLRSREPGAALSREYTGQAFHTWLLRRVRPGDQWRVAAQIADGFAQLNDNAVRLFAAPTEGLQT